MSTAPRRSPPPEVRAEYTAWRERWDSSAIAEGPFVSLRDVGSMITGALLRQEPFALIRLDEDEGCALFREARGFDALSAFVMERAMTAQFGARGWYDDDMDAMAALVVQAVHGASLLTAARRPEGHAKRVAEAPDTVRDLRASVGAMWVQHWLAAQGLPDRRPVYRDASLHFDLLPALRGISAGRRVVMVSGLGEAFHTRLAAAWGAELAGQVHVPGEGVFPDALPRLRDEVQALAAPEVVVLVSAGMCAKPLCIDAAARGAVALDLGAALDVLAGRPVKGQAALVATWKV